MILGRREFFMASDQRTELETELTLEQVKEQLIELGKKRSSLTYKDIMERLAPYEQDQDQIDEFYEHLSELGIDVGNESEDEDEPRHVRNEDGEHDEFNFDDDLSLPPGIKIN